MSLTDAGTELLPCATEVLEDVTAMHEVAVMARRIASDATGRRPQPGVA